MFSGDPTSVPSIDVSCLISSIEVITLARRRTSSWDAKFWVQWIGATEMDGHAANEKRDACSPL